MRTRVFPIEPGRHRRGRLGAGWLCLALAVLVACGETGADTRSPEGAPPAAELLAEADRLFETRLRDDLTRSLELYGEARRLDPSSARAHAGAASVGCLLALYSVREPGTVLPAAEAAAEEALRLEPELASAWAALGLVDYLYRWDFASAESRFLEASRLDPTLATVEHWRGMLLMAQSRFAEAVAAYDRALALRPTSLLYRTKRATILAHAGRREEAIREMESVLDAHPGFALAWRESGFLAISEGRMEDAVAALERAAELTGGASKSTGGLGYAWAVTGRRREAEEVLDEFLERSRSEWVPPMYVALMYSGLGRSEEALDWLGRAVEARDPGVVYLAVKPGFETLRGDPRFAVLLGTIGLG